jgi:hypothetical protein
MTQKPPLNHPMHIGLCILTAGLWLPIYGLLLVMDGTRQRDQRAAATARPVAATPAAVDAAGLARAYQGLTSGEDFPIPEKFRGKCTQEEWNHSVRVGLLKIVKG